MKQVCLYCDFVFDEHIGEFVCSRCGHILTAADKRRNLEKANTLRRAEEDQEVREKGDDVLFK